MNLLGHAYASAAVGRDRPEEVLGAVLPDLASMARVRLDRSRLPGPVAAGVRVHTTADAAFHGLAAFVRGAAALRAELAAAGVAPGPARAVGHVGWELLLDGTLVGTPAEDAYRAAVAQGAAALDGVAPSDRGRFEAFLAHWDPPPVLRYDDPAWVAQRVHAMLAGRDRLRFPPEQVPVVARVLRGHAPAVVAAAPEVLQATTAALATALP